eukprot:1141969-Pelagomonas_calceolata.AAC.3
MRRGVLARLPLWTEQNSQSLLGSVAEIVCTATTDVQNSPCVHGKSVIDGVQLLPRPTALLWMRALQTHVRHEKHEQPRMNATCVPIDQQSQAHCLLILAMHTRPASNYLADVREPSIEAGDEDPDDPFHL